MCPGGNLTGVARMSADLFDDRIKQIKEILPKATQIVALLQHLVILTPDELISQYPVRTIW